MYKVLGEGGRLCGLCGSVLTYFFLFFIYILSGSRGGFIESVSGAFVSFIGHCKPALKIFYLLMYLFMLP